MKKIYTAATIFLLLSQTACKNNSTEIQEISIDSASNKQPDTAAELFDQKTRDMLVELKSLQEKFTGHFIVYNAENKLPKKIYIDSLGSISHSTKYKLLRITPGEQNNLILLIQGTDEQQSKRDTFQYDEMDKQIRLYRSISNKGGVQEKKELVYRFEKQNQ